jgi:hypothetical protein
MGEKTWFLDMHKDGRTRAKVTYLGVRNNDFGENWKEKSGMSC